MLGNGTVAGRCGSHRGLQKSLMGTIPTDIEIVSLDSITHVTAAHRAGVIVAASHGGIYSGYFATTVQPRGVILNDAGIGFGGAGVASLDFLERLSVAAAVVSHWSARIGDGVDMLRSGVISGLNATAASVGCLLGQRCAVAAEAMRAGQPFAGKADAPSEGRYILRSGTVPVLGPIRHRLCVLRMPVPSW